MTGVRHGDQASQGPGAMSTGHLAPVAAPAIVGGKTAFSPGRVGDGKQDKGNANASIHGKISRPPRQQSCREGAKQSRQKLVPSSTLKNHGAPRAKQNLPGDLRARR